LGFLNREGLGGPRNFEQAAKWFEEAAQTQDDRAMLYLGEMYWNGEGVKQSKETAYMWYLIASNSGSTEAAQGVQRLTQEIDPKSIEKAKKKAMQWSAKHSQPGLRRR
jgi:TPR repeat protein